MSETKRLLVYYYSVTSKASRVDKKGSSNHVEETVGRRPVTASRCLPRNKQEDRGSSSSSSNNDDGARNPARGTLSACADGTWARPRVWTRHGGSAGRGQGAILSAPVRVALAGRSRSIDVRPGRAGGFVRIDLDGVAR